MNPKLQTIQENLLRAGIRTFHWADEPQHSEFLRVHGSSEPALIGHTHGTILFIPPAEPDTLTLRTWTAHTISSSVSRDTQFDLRDLNIYGKLIRQIIAVDPEKDQP